MTRLQTSVLVLIVVLMAATACQAVPPATAPVASTAPVSSVAPQPTATAQPKATTASTATVTLQPTAAATFAPTPTYTPHGDPLLPRLCWPATGNRIYLRAEDALCFSFPERFEIASSSPGYARIVGPALEKNHDPIRASLEVTTRKVPADSTLNGLVDAALAEFADFTAWQIKRTPAEIDDEPAIVLEPVPGLLSGRALYFLRGETFHKLYFWPMGVKLAQPDLTALYETVIASFHFLSEPTAAAMVPTGKSITGRVIWGLAPVPGGRVELRRPDWRNNPDSLVMQTEADPAGVYVLVDPPVGDYEVVPAWPADITDGAPLAPGMPVTIAAGEEVTGIDVYLAKKLNVIAPAAGEVISATPTLRWEAFPNARLYRVIITDFATMEGFLGEDTAETSLTVATPLPAGRKLTLVINVLGEAMSLLAVESREFTVKTAPGRVP